MRLALHLAALALALPVAAGAEAYPGLIIPAEIKGIEYKIEITGRDAAGPYDLRIWRLDGKSMAYERKIGRKLAAQACAAESYRFRKESKAVVSAKGELVFTSGCLK